MHPRIASLVLVVSTALATSSASAEATHVVSAGHTLAKIARRYHTSIESLREANGLAPGQKLKLGQRIVIPNRDAAPHEPATTPREAPTASPPSQDQELDSERDRVRSTPRPAARTRVQNGTAITLVRGHEQWTGRTRDRSGHLLPGVSSHFQHMLRDTESNTGRAIDPRLVALLTQISQHFEGKAIEIVSGFRPQAETQHTTHSSHNIGRAADFVVRGVSNEALRDFCYGLRDVGVGYYPNSSFVHLDVRAGTTRWVDESGPGEPPRYTSLSSYPANRNAAANSKQGKPSPAVHAAARTPTKHD